MKATSMLWSICTNRPSRPLVSYLRENATPSSQGWNAYAQAATTWDTGLEMTWTPCLPITPATDDPRPRVVYRTDMLRTLAENSRSTGCLGQSARAADPEMTVLTAVEFITSNPARR